MPACHDTPPSFAFLPPGLYVPVLERYNGSVEARLASERLRQMRTVPASASEGTSGHPWGIELMDLEGNVYADGANTDVHQLNPPWVIELMDLEGNVYADGANTDVHRAAPFGIVGKVTLLFVAVVICLGLLLGVTSLVRHSRELTARFDERTRLLLDGLASDLERPTMLNDREGMARMANPIVERPEVVHCAVLNAQGRTLYEAGSRSDTPSRTYSAAISVERDLDATLDNAMGPATDQGAVEIIGTVQVQISLAALRSNIVHATGPMLVLMLIAVALASVIGYVILRLILGEPVDMLVAATKRIAHGDLDAVAPIERGDEIGLLATALNTMVADLRNTVVSRDYVDKIIDSMNDALFVVDPHGRITRVNLAAEALLGGPAAELTGQPLSHFFAAGPPSSDDGSFSDILDYGGSLRNVETVMRGREGDARVLFSSSGMTDADGKVLAAVCIALNIREWKHAEEELHKLSSAVEQSNSGIALVDLERRLTYANHAYATMHGYANADLIGTPLPEMHPPEQRDLLDEALAEVEVGGSWSGEMLSMTSDGAGFTTYVSATTLRDESGFPIAILIHVNDITRQKELELQLTQAQKLDSIGQLAGGIAHDFNNMLGAISGYADMLRQRLGSSDPNLEKYASRILEAARRSADLTAKLLAFARRGTVEMAPVDLHATILDVFAILEHTIDRRITIVKKLDAPVATVVGDRTQLQNAILNLAVNARDAMPDGGTMAFTTRLVKAEEAPWRGTRPAHIPTHFIKLSVGDTGIGMDEPTLQRIFEPFFTTKQLGKGTGLGLASVYGTLEAHRGLIDVKSRPNEGSTFSIFLPLKVSEVAQTVSTSHDVHHGSGTILIVDDEQLVREMASDMLTSVGYTVVTCNDGTEAVAYFAAHATGVDLVLLDMIMPKMGGYDCYQQLKWINPHVRVIVSSGYSVNDQAQQLITAGAAGFVQKPYDIKVLAKAVSDALGAGDE